MILTLRTDSPDSEIGLYDRNSKQLSYFTWHADRQLAKDLLATIHQRLQKLDADWNDIGGVVVFQGPGSFTGLRIGITVANTLAYGLGAPIVATESEDWIRAGIKQLNNGKNDKIAMPHYGAAANITKPKK